MVAKVTLMVVLVRNSGLVANVIVVAAAGHIYLFRRGASVAESLHIVQCRLLINSPLHHLCLSPHAVPFKYPPAGYSEHQSEDIALHIDTNSTTTEEHAFRWRTFPGPEINKHQPLIG